MNYLPEKKESLWLVIVSPTIWAAHFLLCYITAAIWCAKFAGPDHSLGTVRRVIVAYTVIALVGIIWNGWIGWRRHSFGRGALPHDEDTPEDRHRFLGFSTFLLSALSGVAVIFAALVVIFFWNCN